MNKTQQILKSREEEFDKDFKNVFEIAENDAGNLGEYDFEHCKSFHATTISLLLNSIKEEITQMEQRLPNSKCRNAESRMFGRCFDCEKTKGFNSALSDISTLLSETISNLDK